MVEATLPDKIYFKIGEVAQLSSLKPSVLRFWESEFNELAPAKGRSGQRHYVKRDIELILAIKKLLYVEKLTIEGAKTRLRNEKRASTKHPVECGNKSVIGDEDLRKLVREVKSDLIALREQI